MGLIQDSVVKEISLKTVDEVDKFVEALNALVDLQEWRNNAKDENGDPIDFVQYDSDTGVTPNIIGEDCDHDNLKHLNGSMMNKVLGKVLGGNSTVTDSVVHHLKNTIVSGGPYNGYGYWEIVQMVRRKKLRT